ncbi:hypothetical protein [Paenibacillus macerans]|uniref:hypothetical protein n=1 Tax=Paenibacillus macerans TaxID=44252 RepID=UPI003D316C11
MENFQTIYEFLIIPIWASIFADPGMLVFTRLPISEQGKYVDETKYGSQIPSGSRIAGNYRYDSSDELWHFNSCTTGYFGVNQSGDDVLVTSGHCKALGTSPSAWYQPNFNTETIGDFTFRTSSSGDGSDAASDAGYITLNSKYSPRARVPYPSPTNMAMITGVYVSDTPGDTIYVRGSSTGELLSGTIKYSNVDIYWGSDGYGYNSNEVLAQGYTSG